MAKKSVTQKAIQKEFFENYVGVIGTRQVIEKKSKKDVNKTTIVPMPSNSIKSFSVYIENPSKISLNPLKYMKDSEIIKELIDLYSSSIKEVSRLDKVYDIKIFCRSKNINLGVCKAARLNLSVDIFDKEWVRGNFRNDSYFWYDVPDGLDDKSEIINSLTTRLNILKQIKL